MDRKALAEQLRERQREKKILSPIIISALDKVNDDEMIDSYNKCACGEKYLNNDDLELFIQTSNNAQEFIDNTTDYMIEKQKQCSCKKEKKDRHAWKYKSLPKHVSCITCYYDKDPNEVCRVALVITDLHKDEIVYQKAYMSDDEKSGEEIIEELVTEAGKYDGVIHFISQPVKLQKCSCGCDDYANNFISRKDYKKIYNIK